MAEEYEYNFKTVTYDSLEIAHNSLIITMKFSKLQQTFYWGTVNHQGELSVLHNSWGSDDFGYWMNIVERNLSIENIFKVNLEYINSRKGTC